MEEKTKSIQEQLEELDKVEKEKSKLAQQIPVLEGKIVILASDVQTLHEVECEQQS